MLRTPLTKIKKGIRVKIVEVAMGRQASARLSALGLRVGAYVTKISSFAMRGPVTLKVGSATIALGHSMAEKVFVEGQKVS